MKDSKQLLLDYLAALNKKNQENVMSTGLAPSFEMFLIWLTTGRIEN